MNLDLNRARQLLEKNNYTCVLCKDAQVRTCTARGVRPLLELLDEGGWNGFSAADKVVGKAAACLYVLLGVRAVYAPVMSAAAVCVLESHGICFFYDTKVNAIFNRSRTGFCPMESATSACNDPQQALPVIRETLAKMDREKY